MAEKGLVARWLVSWKRQFLEILWILKGKVLWGALIVFNNLFYYLLIFLESKYALSSLSLSMVLHWRRFSRVLHLAHKALGNLAFIYPFSPISYQSVSSLRLISLSSLVTLNYFWFLKWAALFFTAGWPFVHVIALAWNLFLLNLDLELKTIPIFSEHL